MTRVEITIQNGKVTCIEQKGDELPNPTWDELVVAVTNMIEKN